ncbi:MAG: hypothetical protein V4717_02995 [Bacteroidota bacterium]
MKKKFVLLAAIPLVTAYGYTQSVGIGTQQPKANLHVYSGSAGGAVTHMNGITLESNGNSNLRFVLPEGSASSISFADPVNTKASIVYNPGIAAGAMDFRTNGSHSRLTISAIGYIGINTVVPTNTLDINGSLRVRGNVPRAGSTLVSADDNGNSTWARAYAFRAQGLPDNENSTMATYSWQKVFFNPVARYNIGLQYQPGASQFAVPVKGIYHFNAQVQWVTKTLNVQMRMRINRDGNVFDQAYHTWGNNRDEYDNITKTTSFALDAQLEAGDLVWLEIYHHGFDGVVSGSPSATWFSGHLVTTIY